MILQSETNKTYKKHVLFFFSGCVAYLCLGKTHWIAVTGVVFLVQKDKDAAVPEVKSTRAHGK